MMYLLNRSVFHLFGVEWTVGQVKYGIYCIRIEDVIRGYARRIGRARWLPVAHMPAEVLRLQVQAEQLAFFKVLIAKRRNNIFPVRMFRIDGWIEWIECIMAVTARHPD